jgi:hypothetical protein
MGNLPRRAAPNLFQDLLVTGKWLKLKSDIDPEINSG